MPEPTVSEKISLLQAGFDHAEKMFELHTARFEAIGRFNVAIADARIKYAQANGVFLDNLKKAWRLEELRALKATIIRRKTISESELNRKRTLSKRAFSLHSGDRMTENVPHAWQGLYTLINQASQESQLKLSELIFTPECADQRSFRLMSETAKHRSRPYNPLIPLNSLETLAARMRYYYFAPRFGSAPHSLVLDGLRIVMPHANEDEAIAKKELETANSELESLLRDIASGKVFGELPAPKTTS